MPLSTGCPVPSMSGCGRSNFCEGPSMAIPALARDFKEFLKLLNSNSVEYLLIGGDAGGIYCHVRGPHDLGILVNVSSGKATRNDFARCEVGVARAGAGPG